MPGSRVFERTCQLVAEQTALSPFEARAALEDALRQAHLSPDSVGRDELLLAVQGPLARALTERGVVEPERHAQEVGRAVARLESGEPSPYEIFARLA